MRGSTPLDVAASSVMDNNELALGLEEPDLEKVTGLGGALCLLSPAYSTAKPRKSRPKAEPASEPPQHVRKVGRDVSPGSRVIIRTRASPVGRTCQLHRHLHLLPILSSDCFLDWTADATDNALSPFGEEPSSQEEGDKENAVNCVVGLGAARSRHLTPTRGSGRALSKEVTPRLGRSYLITLKTSLCQECLNFRDESMVCLNFRKLAVTRALKLAGSAEKGDETEMNGPQAAITANSRGPYTCGITVCQAPLRIKSCDPQDKPFYHCPSYRRGN